MPKGDDDATLLAKIAAGDKVAFSALLERHLHALIKFARRYTGNLADAEDIVQETFTKVWLKASDWRDQGLSASSWLYRITYHSCVDLARRNRRDVSLEGLELTAALNDDPAEQAAHAAGLTQLVASMGLLPERQSTAIVLCVYEGLSNKDAAAVMGLGVEALESLLARGRRRLRELLLQEKEGADDT